MTAAYDVYRFACEHGSPDGCTAASLMTEWALAPSGRAAPSAEALP